MPVKEALRRLCRIDPLKWHQLLAVLAFLNATWFSLRYANQPLFDLHSFRQTQTALTSLWFIKEGYQLAYQTPVGGAPWILPFEFPLYQTLVALIAQMTPFGLDAVGRIVSWLFLLATLWPVRLCVQRLELNPRVFWTFATLFLASPLYLYWGRSFMIETAALFLTVACAPWFLDLLADKLSPAKAVAFSIVATLAVLQKSTTALPLLGIFGLIYLGQSLWQRRLNLGRIATMVGCFGIPLAVGVVWVKYTDALKSGTTFGLQLTSGKLSAWTWGTLAQRLRAETYTRIGTRIVNDSLGGWLGLALLLTALTPAATPTVRRTALCCLCAALLPLLAFLNLHYVHNYYQSSAVIYLIFALALVLGQVLPGLKLPTSINLLLILGVLVSNARDFERVYHPAILAQHTQQSSLDLQVATELKKELGEDEAFIAYGYEWNSALAYYSERKSFTVPNFFADWKGVLNTPERFIGRKQLGAIVVHSATKPGTFERLKGWFERTGRWRTVTKRSGARRFHILYPQAAGSHDATQGPGTGP